MRRLASAAPRSTNQEMSRPTATPIAPARSAIHHSRTVPVAEAPDRETGRDQQAADDERGDADLAAAGDLDERLCVQPRGLRSPRSREPGSDCISRIQ